MRISPRIDYQLSTNNTLTLRYGYTRNDLQDQGAGNLSLLTNAYHALDTDHTLQIIETAVLSTKVINETRFQLYHTQDNQLTNNNLPGCHRGWSIQRRRRTGGTHHRHRKSLRAAELHHDFGRRAYLEVRRSYARRHHQQFFAARISADRTSSTAARRRI